MYKRLKVLLRYTACTGLINQQYSHIAAFSLAAVLGAEIVLPPAAKRDSFAHYFSVFKVRWLCSVLVYCNRTGTNAGQSTCTIFPGSVQPCAPHVLVGFSPSRSTMRCRGRRRRSSLC